MQNKLETFAVEGFATDQCQRVFIAVITPATNFWKRKNWERLVTQC